MIHTFKFGTVPNGRVIESRPEFDDGEPYWLVVIDDEPVRSPPVEIYLKRTGS